MNHSISKRGRGEAGIVGYVLFKNPIRAFDPLLTILATKAILETAATRKTEKSTTYGDLCSHDVRDMPCPNPITKMNE